jgi:hypothetical protein
VNVRSVDPGTRIGAQRGEVVVCIPVYGAHELFVECLQSVLTHTPASVPIRICDDASPDSPPYELVAGLGGDPTSGHHLCYGRHDHNVGFTANTKGGFAAATRAGVVILSSDCVVASGPLDPLRDAAYSDGCLLSGDLERPLLALAAHPHIGERMFRTIKAGYRVSNRLRRLAARPGDANGIIDPAR